MGAQNKKKMLFGEVAIQRGLCTPEQIASALERQHALREAGIRKTLGAILHDMDVLTLVQVNEILDQIEGARRRRSIEGYEIIKRLGKGGMGTVYLGRQLSVNRLVAIKVLPPRLAQNKDYLVRFRREAQATAKLNHRNIVAAYDVGESNGYHYFVMEFVEGEMVKDLLARTGQLDEARALDITIQAAQALGHAWEHGIVHRDIKPANLMITRDGTVKVCDFGLAIDTALDHSITRSGVIMGTPYYLSPEQARSEELDIRSDIYSLGATLFHFVTGSVPFDGDSPAAILTAHVTEPPPDPRRRNPLVSPELASIIMRMLAKDPADRYADPGELLLDLEACRDGRPLPIADQRRRTRENAIRRGRRRRLLVRAALLLAWLAMSAPLAQPAAWAHGLRRVRLLVQQSRALEHTLSGTKHSLMDDPEALEEQARLALAEAERQIAAAPDDVQLARRVLGEITSRFPETLTARRAQERLRGVNQRIEREAKAAYFAAATRARELAKADRFAEARASLIAFPERYRRTPWYGQAHKELEAVHTLARERLRALEREAARDVERGRYERAVSTLRTATTFGFPDVVEQARRKLEDLETLSRDRTRRAYARRRERALRALVVLWGELQAACRSGGLGAALERVEAIDREQEGAEADVALLGQALRRILGDLRRLDEAWSLELARLRARTGLPVQVRVAGVEQSGRLVQVGTDELLLERRGRVLAYPLRALDAQTWLGGGSVAERKEAARLVAVWTLLQEQDLTRAQAALDRARALGADTAPYDMLLTERADAAAARTPRR